MVATSERAVLSAMLFDRSAIEPAAELLQPADFSIVTHAVLFRTLVGMHGRGEAIDPVTVQAELVRTGDERAVEQLVEVAGSHGATENLATYASDIRAHALERHLKRVGLELQTSPSILTLDRYRPILDRLATPLDRRPSLQPVTAAALAGLQLRQIESFVHDAALPRGHVTMLHGKGGLGKTYLAIGLGLSVATGLPWLTLPVRAGRAMLVTYELPEAVAQSQVLEWCQELDVFPPEEFLLVTMEQLAGKLMEPGPGESAAEPRRRLIDLARQHQIDVLVLDPWRNFHHAEERDDRSMSQLMESLQIIAAEARVALLLLHHDRKGSPGEKIDDSADAARGSSVMRDAARSVAWLHEAKGKLCIEFHKVNLGSKPDPIWLDRRVHQPPTVSEPPEEESARGRKNRLQRLREFLIAHPEGVSRLQAANHVEVTERTMTRYLAQLQTRNLRPTGEQGLYVLEES